MLSIHSRDLSGNVEINLEKKKERRKKKLEQSTNLYIYIWKYRGCNGIYLYLLDDLKKKKKERKIFYSGTAFTKKVDKSDFHFDARLIFIQLVPVCLIV